MIIAANLSHSPFESFYPSLLFLRWELGKMSDRQIGETINEFFLANFFFCLCHCPTPFIPSTSYYHWYSLMYKRELSGLSVLTSCIIPG